MPVLRVSILLILLACTAVRAETWDSFLVRNIAEDIHDDNLVQGRAKALLYAQRDGYQILLQRLTAQADWAKLPKLEDGALENIVLDVGIDQEKIGPAHILATISVRFKPDSVRHLLRSSGIAYAEWRGRPVMILPVWQAETAAVFAEANNPWRELWRMGKAGGLVPEQVPGMENLDSLTGEALVKGDGTLLADLSQRLNAPDVLVVLAAPGKGENNLPKLDLTLSGIGSLAGRMSGQRGYGGEPGETEAQLLQRAANDLARSLDDEFKAGNLLQYDKQGSLTVLAPFSGLDDWMAVRGRLSRSTAVRTYDVTALSRNEALLVLHFVGERSQLDQILMQNGLVLTWDDEHWALRTTGVAGK